MLMRLAEDDEMTTANFKELVDRASGLMGGGGQEVGFMIQCLLVTLREGRSQKFDILFGRIEGKVEDDGRIWRKLFRPILLKALSFSSASELKKILCLAFDSGQHRLGSPEFNDPFLFLACERGNYDFVKALVAYGYRFKLPDIGSRKRNMWSGILQQQQDSDEDGAERDDVYAIRILTLMSSPAYIFACYAVVAEERDLEGKESVCECVGITKPKVFVHNTSKISVLVDESRTESTMVANCLEESVHYCPGSNKFKPRDDCFHHLECNDPIYRCFDIARLTYEASQIYPEYRTEFMEIAKRCRSLATKILSQCKNSKEVSVLLQEKTASTKYFKEFTTSMKFPRVRLAIEHNHKEFATHMYCQQFLRKQWHGKVNDWQSRSLLSKVLYFLVQTLLSPLYAVQSTVVQIGRDISAMRGNVHDDGSDPPSTRLQKFLEYCDNAVTNLDSPLNRFLTSNGYFLIFLVCILIAVIRPVSDRVSLRLGPLEWYEWYLLVHSSTVLFGYLVLFSMLKSVSHFFNFWRVFELFRSLSCFLAVVLTFYLNLASCNEKEIFPDVYIVVCPDEKASSRKRS